MTALIVIDESGVALQWELDQDGNVIVIDEHGVEHLWGSQEIGQSFGRYEEHVNIVRVLALNLLTSGTSFGTIIGDVGLKVLWDNAGKDSEPTDGPWVRVMVEYTGCEQTSIGADEDFRFTGNLRIDLYSKVPLGDRSLLRSFDTLLRATSNLRVADVQFGEPGATEQGRRGADWLVGFVAPFEFYTVESKPTPGAPVSSTAQNVEAAASIIRGRFDSMIGDVYGLPINWDAVSSDLPTEDLWSNLHILIGASSRVQSGARSNYLQNALALVQIHTRIGLGDISAVRIADHIFDAFHSVSVGGVAIEHAVLTTVGRDGGWWVNDVMIPFSFEELA